MTEDLQDHFLDNLRVTQKISIALSTLFQSPEVHDDTLDAHRR
jgi:hypothetical protein